METTAILVAGALLSLSLTSCSRVEAHAKSAVAEGVPVRLARVEVRDVPVEIAAVGNVEAIESVEVKPRIAGQIRSVAFTEGQNVTKGQVLFTIGRETLERQQAEEEAVLARDVAMEEQARAVAERDAASERQRKSEAEVAVKLGELGVMSGQSVDQAVTQSATARAGSHADQAAIAAAGGAVAADRARIAETRLSLGFADVVAPISGRAGALMAKTGSMVREGETTLVTVLEIAPIRVTFGIPEQALAEVQRLSALGPLEVEAGSGDSSGVVGRLEFIDNTVDAATGMVRLKAAFANTDGGLWPGEFVHVRLRLRVEAGRTVVPSAAVQQGMAGRYVWWVEGDVAKMVPVTLMRTYRLGDGVEGAVVQGGLRGGDAVVTEGQMRLTPGVRVAGDGG